MEMEDGWPTIYRDLAGEHEDWDAYRRAMVTERRVVVRFTPTRTYGMLQLPPPSGTRGGYDRGPHPGGCLLGSVSRRYSYPAGCERTSCHPARPGSRPRFLGRELPGTGSGTLVAPPVPPHRGFPPSGGHARGWSLA